MNQPITASIDLAQLDKLDERVQHAKKWDLNVVEGAKPAILAQLIALARRSLTSGAPAGMTPAYLAWHENFWIEVAQTDYEGAENNERRIVYEFTQEGK